MGLQPSGPDSQAHWSVRSMRNGYWLFCLVLLVGAIGMLAVGGRPDPTGSGQVLDGAWRFHAGDDPAWADPRADDRSWDRLTLVSRPEVHDGDVGIPGYLDGWRAHGHSQLDGYGWYRKQVILPPQGDLVLVGPPAVDDGYEMFWNGHPLGGVGRLSGSPRVGITRPRIVPLPASNGAHTAVLAIRAFMQPGAGRDGQSGGLRTVPVLAPRAQGEALYRAQWRRTIAGYIAEAVEPAAMLVLAIVALVSAPRLTHPAFARWLALALLASGCLRLGNAIIAWTDLLSQSELGWQNGVIFVPLSKIAWTIAWNHWTDGRGRRLISWIAVAAGLALVASALASSPLLASAGRTVFALSLLAIAVRIVRHGDHKWLALTAMALTAIVLFPADLSTLGVPSIWFPFNIGVSRSQYAYALALPLLAYLLAAADRPDDGQPVRSARR